MKASAAAFVSIGECGDVEGVAVVIDVLRAFTTAAWAFHQGVERIVLCDDLDVALRLKAALPGALALKDGEPLPGFDLSNSPAQMSRRTDLKGRTLVQRTTAGTVGAVAARSASSLYCASFVCAGATAAALRRDATAATFVVSGEDGAADEDRACAEYIAGLVSDSVLDATPFLQRAAASRAACRLRNDAAAGHRGIDPDDVDLCLQLDRFPFAMRAAEEDGLLVLRRTR